MNKCPTCVHVMQQTNCAVGVIRFYCIKRMHYVESSQSCREHSISLLYRKFQELKQIHTSTRALAPARGVS